MEIIENSANGMPRRRPWNRGKLVGAKPPLRPKHVWSIRTRLQLENRKRDLALFNLAIDSKLRGCDLVSIMVEDVAPRGCCLDRATVRQKKTGHPVIFEMTEQTRQSVDDYLLLSTRAPGQPLFAGRRKGRGLTTRQYARLLSDWISSIGLDPSLYGTHSLRRTKQHSSTNEQRTFAPDNFCSATPRSRAPCATWASRSMTHWQLRNKLTSKMPGQSRCALPRF